MATLKVDFNRLEFELKAENKLLSSKFENIEAKFGNLEISLKSKMTAFENNIEFKIQKAINSNMRWSIGLIAFLVTVLRLIDVLASKLPNIF